MAANYILPFAQGGGANVQDTPTYTADAARPLGHQPGVARSNFANKAMRQASAMVAGLAQFLADNQATDVTDDLLAAAISTMMTNACKAAAQSPAGTIVWIPGTSPLPNTVKINGALLSRATYPRLYTFGNTSGNMAASDGAWVSGQFSPGDGTTTFRVPDIRGYILRAFDDGRGIDAGRLIGSVQADQMLTHGHTTNESPHAHATSVGDGGHVHNFYAAAGAGATPSMAVLQNGTPGNVATQTGFTGITVGIVAGVTGITINNYVGGSEVRVKNIALMPVMYY